MFSSGDVQPSAFNTPGIATLNLRGIGANRAPNVAELFTGATTSVVFFPGGDPCLRNEEADTYTFGVVLNSPFSGALENLTLSVDWYQVEIT